MFSFCKKFSEMHNDVDIHSNNIRFPTEFDIQTAQDLLLKVFISYFFFDLEIFEAELI